MSLEWDGDHTSGLLVIIGILSVVFLIVYSASGNFSTEEMRCESMCKSKYNSERIRFTEEQFLEYTKDIQDCALQCVDIIHNNGDYESISNTAVFDKS